MSAVVGGANGKKWVVVPVAWQKMAEEACVLKEALDHVMRWYEKSIGAKWIEESLDREGLIIPDFELADLRNAPGMPFSFGQLLLGRWYTYGNEGTGESHESVDIPPGCVLGWSRKDEYQPTPSLSQADMVAKASVVAISSTGSSNVTTWGFEGLPLYWAGEGKNRTQLFRLAGMTRNSPLTLFALPDVSRMVARPVARMPGLTALHRKDEQGRLKVDILPFSALSRRMLSALGVAWSDRPSFRAWLAMKDAGRDPLKLSGLVRLRSSETRLRLAMIGGPKLAGLVED